MKNILITFITTSLLWIAWLCWFCREEIADGLRERESWGREQ